jgi:hypothetical protein
MWKKYFGASWRTAATGYLAGIALLVKNAIAVLDTDSKTVFVWEEVAAALGMLGLGYTARDNSVSSEQVRSEEK